MREFKKNTWTLIKRLSLGLALAVPGLYQGHAQAQNIVLNFSGTISAAPCLLRVTPMAGSGSTVTAASASSTTSTIALPNLNYADVYNATPGTSFDGSTTFKVELAGPAGGTSACIGTKFQVALFAPVGNVDTTLIGRNLLVNQPNGQVGLEIAARSNLNTSYAPLQNLPVANGVGQIEISTYKSNVTNLNSVSPLGGNFEFSVTPVKIAAAGTALAQTRYGGSITLQASYN